MRTTRTITASLAAVLGAVALAGPAAADSQQAAGDSAKANVYVPPATSVSHAGAIAADSAKANVYVPPASSSNDAGAAAADSTKANVYVPPATSSNDAGAVAADSAKANVYVPPATSSNDGVAADSAKANVYVPPTTSSNNAGAADSAKANVYVPPNPRAIQRHVTAASGSSSGFDWGSAGIGFAVAIGASLIAIGGAAGLRRRQVQPAATG